MEIDDPDWLCLLASGLKMQLDTVEEEFTSLLKSWSVLGYHGCRSNTAEPTHQFHRLFRARSKAFA